MKKILSIVVAIFFSTQLHAQHELSVGAGFGSACFAGLGYTYQLNESWGLRTGFEAVFHSFTTTTGGISESYALHSDWHNTPAGYEFIYDALIDDEIEEKVQLTYLNIPLMAQYSHTFKRHALYGAGGVKVGIPLSGTYKSNTVDVTATGYSEYTQQTYKDIPQEGFTTYRDLSGSGDFDLKVGVWLSLEAGMMWRFSNEKLRLYTGLYFSYPLNAFDNPQLGKDYASDGQAHYVQYNGANVPAIGSIAMPLDKMDAMALGITLRLAFSMNKGTRNAAITSQ